MSNRTITKHQFSDQTTIDGNRIEGALQDVQNRFNSFEFKDIDAWVEVPYYWANTPALVDSSQNNDIYYGPWAWVFRSYMPNDLDNEPPNNPFRIKSCSRTDPDTGLPIYPPSSEVSFDTGWLWTTTKYFDKPTIINDFTVMGLFDAALDDTDLGKIDGGYYFNNKWYDEPSEEWFRHVMIWIIVDNPLNTGDTFIRNNEVHMWGFDEGTFIMSNNLGVVPVNYTYGQNITWRPDAVVDRTNGGAFRLQNLNIPLFSGSRVRFVVGLPGANDLVADDFPNFTGQAIGEYDGNLWSDNPTNPQANNIWTVNVSTFQPLEKIDE